MSFFAPELSRLQEFERSRCRARTFNGPLGDRADFFETTSPNATADDPPDGGINLGNMRDAVLSKRWFDITAWRIAGNSYFALNTNWKGRNIHRNAAGVWSDILGSTEDVNAIVEPITAGSHFHATPGSSAIKIFANASFQDNSGAPTSSGFMWVGLGDGTCAGSVSRTRIARASSSSAFIIAFEIWLTTSGAAGWLNFANRTMDTSMGAVQVCYPTLFQDTFTLPAARWHEIPFPSLSGSTNGSFSGGFVGRVHYLICESRSAWESRTGVTLVFAPFMSSSAGPASSSFVASAG